MVINISVQYNGGFLLDIILLTQGYYHRGTRLNTCCCCCCCCCLHIKSRSDLYSVLSNIRTGPTDANAFRGHRLTTQKGYTYQKEIKGPREVNTHATIGKEMKTPRKIIRLQTVRRRRRHVRQRR